MALLWSSGVKLLAGLAGLLLCICLAGCVALERDLPTQETPRQLSQLAKPQMQPGSGLAEIRDSVAEEMPPAGVTLTPEFAVYGPETTHVVVTWLNESESYIYIGEAFKFEYWQDDTWRDSGVRLLGNNAGFDLAPGESRQIVYGINQPEHLQGFYLLEQEVGFEPAAISLLQNIYPDGPWQQGLYRIRAEYALSSSGELRSWPRYDAFAPILIGAAMPDMPESGHSPPMDEPTQTTSAGSLPPQPSLYEAEALPQAADVVLTVQAPKRGRQGCVVLQNRSTQSFNFSQGLYCERLKDGEWFYLPNSRFGLWSDYTLLPQDTHTFALGPLYSYIPGQYRLWLRLTDQENQTVYATMAYFTLAD